MRIRPARTIRGKLSVPGDKSISHRAAIIAALAGGTSSISNFAPGADCAATVNCLKSLGVFFTQQGRNLIVHGVGRDGLRQASQPLDCANSASTMRLLAGVLASQNFFSTMIGDRSLSTRPMTRIIEPLTAMGATLQSHDGKPPLTIFGSGPLKAISYDLPISSAQVKSCILLAGLNSSGVTTLRESLGQSRDHTERMLQWFGASLSRQALGEMQVIELEGPASLSARAITVPGDISSAAFFVAAAALLPNSNLILDDVGVNPTRTGFLSVLESIGFSIELRDVREENNEPLGSIHISQHGPSIQSQTILSGASVAKVIDELPLLAILGSQLPGGIEIRDAEELRLKESDRIAATVKNLRAMGATVREFDDGMEVNASRLKGARIESFGDHRIAMAFTVAALVAEGESEIDDPDCVGVSFPDFFQRLESLV